MASNVENIMEMMQQMLDKMNGIRGVASYHRQVAGHASLQDSGDRGEDHAPGEGSASASTTTATDGLDSRRSPPQSRSII
jgi:hypothetical protein